MWHLELKEMKAEVVILAFLTVPSLGENAIILHSDLAFVELQCG